jgi:hypothetical protein
MVGPIARVDFLPGFDEGGQTNLFIMPPRFRSLRAHASDRYLLLERPLLQSRRPDGSTGHFEGLTLFLYNPEAHQWGQYFANSAAGILNLPVIGEFKNGRGEFFDQETFNDRAILVRMVWSDIITDSHHLEQSFSGDGGKAWEPNFIATMTRENEIQKKSESVCPQPSELPDPHMISTSILVSGKLTSPACNILSPANTWVDYDGTSVVSKIWRGRASLFEGHFYDQEDFQGRSILDRNGFSDIKPNSSRFEQAFSDDGGKNWETNWIMTFTR